MKVNICDICDKIIGHKTGCNAESVRPYVDKDNR